MLYLKREIFDGLSEKIGKSFSKIPMSPNQWTILSLILSVVTAYFLIKQDFVYASVVFFFMACLDIIDGSVARVSQKATKFGAYLDTVMDRITEFLVVFGLFFVNLPDFLLSSKRWLLILFFGSQMTTYVKAAAFEKKLTDKELRGGILERPERLILLFIVILLLNFSTTDSLYVLILAAVLTNLTALQRFYKASKS